MFQQHEQTDETGSLASGQDTKEGDEKSVTSAPTTAGSHLGFSSVDTYSADTSNFGTVFNVCTYTSSASGEARKSKQNKTATSANKSEGCDGKSGKHVGAEDDGYLMDIVYHPKTNTSSFVVIDAKTMNSKPVFISELPQRVPFGVHGIWLDQDHFKE